MTSSSRTPSFILEKRSSDDTSSIEENDWRPEPHPAVRPLWLGLQPSHPESLKIRDEDDNQQYPGSWELALVIAGLCVAVFLLSVDRTIVTTALPYISNEFQAFSNFGKQIFQPFHHSARPAPLHHCSGNEPVSAKWFSIQHNIYIALGGPVDVLTFGLCAF